MCSNTVCEVILTRADVTEPWGFSLAGGRLYSQDLLVTGTQLGRPAAFKLEAGEVIVGINGVDVADACLNTAASIANEAGHQLVLHVDRKHLMINHLTEITLHFEMKL